MNKGNFTFESENLVVDWISFKFSDLEKVDQKDIVDYLFTLGFNSYQESGKLVKPIKEPIKINQTNKYEVHFINEIPYWSGTVMHFSGSNAKFFYKLIQQNSIDWSIFSGGILNRLDLYYSRKNNKDKFSKQDFLTNCQEHLRERNRNVSFEKNKKGGILKIGSRKSDLYSRIYEEKDFLKFEHEIKGKFLENYHLLLVSNQLEEFENQLAFHFLTYFGRLLPLELSYMDWLVTKLRPIRVQPYFPDTLNSDYVRSEILAEPRDFLVLLKFITYARNLHFEIKYMDDIAYREVVFELRDFLQFQNQTIQPGNKYQLRKIRNFFDKLQKGCLITSFTNTYFQSLVAIPKVKFEICSKQKCWIGKVFIVEELFSYQYPFFIPNLFQDKLTKLEFYVRLKFIQVFCSVSLEKNFLIQEFLDNYGSVLSHQDQKKMKHELIELVKDFKEKNLIRENYKILRNGSIFNAKELTIQNISEGFLLVEALNINPNLNNNNNIKSDISRNFEKSF